MRRATQHRLKHLLPTPGGGICRRPERFFACLGTSLRHCSHSPNDCQSPTPALHLDVLPVIFPNEERAPDQERHLIPSDTRLDGAGLAGQQQATAVSIAAGDSNSPSVGKAAAAGAANAGGQVAGAAVAPRCRTVRRTWWPGRETRWRRRRAASGRKHGSGCRGAAARDRSQGATGFARQIDCSQGVPVGGARVPGKTAFRRRIQNARRRAGRGKPAPVTVAAVQTAATEPFGWSEPSIPVRRSAATNQPAPLWSSI